jgi:hypothetical protein
MGWSKVSDIENKGVATDDGKWVAAKGTARLWRNAPVILGIVTLHGVVAPIGKTGLVGPLDHGLGVGRRAYLQPQRRRLTVVAITEAAGSISCRQSTDPRE